MNKFSTVNISDLGQTITGKTPSSKFPVDFGREIPFVTPSDPFDQKYIDQTERYLSNEGVKKLKGKLLPPKSVMVTCIGSAMGKIAMTRASSITNQQINSIIVSENHSPEYVYYALKNNYKTLRNAATGSTALPLLNKSDFDLLKIRIHNKKDAQQKIAAVLSTLDAKIELNNRINAELEAMAKTLYDYWFVQFDFPDDNGKPYKSSGGKMTYNPTLKREIPEGWEDTSLWDIAEYYNGLALQKYRPTSDEFLRVIKIKEMGEGFSEKSEKASVDIPLQAIVKNGDVLFSWSATLEVQIWSKGIGALNQHIFKVTSRNHPRTYYYFELRNYLNHFKMMADKRKTTMGHITQDHLKQSRICKPPAGLITQLHECINPMLEKQLVLAKENQELAELRDWLLPLLMNGQVTVKTPFDHIPISERSTKWFSLLEPVLQARLARENPAESRLIQTLNEIRGSHDWKTCKKIIETNLELVENGERIFSRKKEVQFADNPDHPIEEMIAEFRAIGYLRQKGFSNLKYFRQEGSDFQVTFENQLYHIEVTYIHGPNLKTFHHNPDSVDVILDRNDPNYLDKRQELLKNWDFSKKLLDLLKSKYLKKENQILKRNVPLDNSLILIITDLEETNEPWFDHVRIEGLHPILHFVKTRKIATVVHGSGTVYEPDPTALAGVFGKLGIFAWEKYL